MDEARDNNDYYELKGYSHLGIWVNEEQSDFRNRPKQTSSILRGTIDAIAKVYEHAPTRALTDQPEASDWLQKVYDSNFFNDKMMEADRQVYLNSYCAIEVYPNVDQDSGNPINPDRPINLYLYGRDEVFAWTTEDDPDKPYAMLTKAYFEELGQFKYVLWTEAEYREYWTDERHVGNSAELSTIAVQEPKEFKVKPNPYGVIPFVIISEPIVRTLGGRGIGTELRMLNENIDEILTYAIALHTRFVLPVGTVQNVRSDYTPDFTPGGFTILPAMPGVKMGEDNMPKAAYLQTEIGGNSAAMWAHIRNSAETKLEELGVPAGIVYRDASTDLSGVAVVAKTGPLLAKLRRRQIQMGVAETAIARLIFRVYGKTYGRDDFVRYADKLRMLLTWAPPQLEFPTPERLASDESDIANGYKTHIDVLMERHGITEEDAFKKFEHILETNARMNAIKSKYEVLGSDDPAPDTLETPDDAERGNEQNRDGIDADPQE